VFNIRMVLEDNGQVFPLHFSRCEHGVAYFQLAAGSAQRPEERQDRGCVDAVGGQPADTKTLSPGAEDGEDTVPPDAASTRTEALGAPAPGDHELSPSPIGQAIMASEPVPQRRARAEAKPRLRR
jgi:hypothetical protein